MNLHEDWMIRLGDYGDVSERNPLQFTIDRNKLKSNPQHFRFNGKFATDHSDDIIIDMHTGSAEHVSGNFNKPFSKHDILPVDNRSIRNLGEQQTFAQDAGLPLVDEIDHFINSVRDLNTVYDPTADYATIPNWNDSTAYVQGDLVRRDGKVYRLNIDAAGLQSSRSDVIIRGSDIFPQVANGLTFIANGEIVTFSKTEEQQTIEPIVLTGTVTAPSIPSGTILIIDGNSITFTKSVTETTYNDIELIGSIVNPVITNSASRTLVIYYANSSTASLTPVTVAFNEKDPNLTMQEIWARALNTAGSPNPNTLASERIARLEAVRASYVSANSVSAWETLVNSYYDNFAVPDRFVNPERIGTELRTDAPRLSISTITKSGTTITVTTSSNHNLSTNDAVTVEGVTGDQASTVNLTNRTITVINSTSFTYESTDSSVTTNLTGGTTFLYLPWEASARSLIQSDLDLIANLSGTTTTETVNSMIIGTLNNSRFNTDRDSANTLLDANNTDGRNLQRFVRHVRRNGGDTIAEAALVEINAVSDQINYKRDDISSIVAKINSALLAANAPSGIRAENSNNALRIVRTGNQEGYRLGVSSDVTLGFDSQVNDIQTAENNQIVASDLSLDEAITEINNTGIANVTASNFNNRLRLEKGNNSNRISIGNTPATGVFGLGSGTTNASITTSTRQVDLRIDDIILQINNENIPNLLASQIDGTLLLTYSGETLILGNGTANATLGISSGTYTSRTSDIENEFSPSQWAEIVDPAHFNIWTIRNIDAPIGITETTTNSYDVYQTIDFELDVSEICVGAESGDEGLIRCNKEHQLEVGEYVLIVNSTCIPSMDGIHQVLQTSSDDNRNFFINRFIEEKGFSGKVIPLRSVRFADLSEARNAINDSKYVDQNLGLKENDVIYIDSIDDSGRGGVYKIIRTTNSADIELVRTEEGKTNNSKIKNGILFSYSTGNVISTHEVYDPLKGIIPGIADNEIDFRSEVDFAYYNATTNPETQTHPENSWGQSQVGNVWWDLSNAIYINYDQGSPDYRQEHWGGLFPTSTIDIYEWTKSPVTPDEYLSAVRAGTTIDGIELTGSPYRTVDVYGDIQYNWCEEIELNSITNQVETYYYFWVKNKTTTPSIERQYSVTQLADIIRNPNTQDIAWLAASSENTVLISSLHKNSGLDDLVMQVNFDSNSSDYHQEFMLLSENNPNTQIPEWLHLGLRDSLSGFNQGSTTYTFRDWHSAKSFSANDIVRRSEKFYRARVQNNQDPDNDTTNEYWTRLEAEVVNPDGDYTSNEYRVRIQEPYAVPDTRLHQYARYGIGRRPRQSWFRDISKARKSLVDILNDQLSKIAFVNIDRPWQNELIKTFSLTAFRDDDQDKQYDLEDYWDFIDWSEENFNFDLSQIDYYDEEFDVTRSGEENELLQIQSEPDDTSDRQVYQYRNGQWVLVYKKNGTIRFNRLLWDGDSLNSGWDNAVWDSTEWDKDSGPAVIEILNSFYQKIWTNDLKYLYTELWFYMVKHAMAEQGGLDWIFKSSYFTVDAVDSIQRQYGKHVDQNDDAFFDYINSTKPFRSKLKDEIATKTVTDDIEINSSDTVEIRVQTNQSGSTEDSSSRSFRITIGSDGQNYTSQILNNQKVLLASKIDADDIVVPILEVNTLADSGVVWINGERISYSSRDTTTITAQFASNDVTLLKGIERGTVGGAIARPHKFADIVEGQSTTELIDVNGERQIPSSYTNSAWNTPGETLLSSSNADTVGIAIRDGSVGHLNVTGTLATARTSALGESSSDIEDLRQEIKSQN